MWCCQRLTTELGESPDWLGSGKVKGSPEFASDYQAINNPTVADSRISMALENSAVARQKLTLAGHITTSDLVGLRRV